MESEGDEVTFLPYREVRRQMDMESEGDEVTFLPYKKSVDRWTWNQKVTKSLFYGIVCNRTRDAV